MNGTTMVVVIVAIVFISQMVSKIIVGKKANKSVDEKDMQRLLEINEQLNASVGALQTRVANLEAIVTQEGYDLKSKINSL